MDLNFVASSTIQPARFVTPSGDNTVTQSVLGDEPIGISGVAVKYAPIPQITNNPGAEAGDTLQVYGLGDYCLLVLGSGGCNAGDFLKPDGSGQGIVSGNTAVDAVGARAVNGGAVGEFVRVQIVTGRGA